MDGAQIYQMVSGLGDAFSGAYKASRKEALAADLGQKIKAGDFGGAADVALQGGDVATGLSLVKLGEGRAANKQFADGFGSYLAGGASGASAEGALGPTAAREESGSATPQRLPSFAGGGAAMRAPGSGGETETRFIDALKAGGLTNPYGLGAVAAYASHESGYKGTNINGSWSDPSERGQPGTSGGILSWRGDRFANMRRLTAGAADPVAAQAKFTLTENPDLTMALQRAQSPEEANRLMADAWRFAGYNRPGGEFAARLGSTREYVARMGGGQAGPTQVAASEPDAANMPAPDAQTAEFRIPPAESAPAQRLPVADSIATTATLSRAGIPLGAASAIGRLAPGSPERINKLVQLSMISGLGEAQQAVVKTFLAQELKQGELPDPVKQYIFARSPAGGGFDGTFAEFQSKKGDEGAKIAAQLAAREKWLVDRGMDPKEPGNQAWLMGGKNSASHVLKVGDILTGAGGQTLARNEGLAATGMNDQTADFLAERVLAGDTKALIGLGRGAQGAENLGKIQGLVAQKAADRGIDGSDILYSAAKAQGLGAQERSLGTSTGRMAAASVEAEGAIKLGLEASAAVPRGSFVPLNRAIQLVQSNTGDPALKQFVAANTTIVNTFARAISPSGTPTVSDKEHAREMLSTADSPEAYAAVLQQMQKEIDMAHRAPQQARTILERERQSAKSGTATTGDGEAASRFEPGKTKIDVEDGKALKAAPDTAENRRTFDARYGEGAARRVLGRPLPGAATRQGQDAKAPVSGAKMAPDGKWYVPDPSRGPGKYLEVQP